MLAIRRVKGVLFLSSITQLSFGLVARWTLDPIARISLCRFSTSKLIRSGNSRFWWGHPALRTWLWLVPLGVTPGSSCWTRWAGGMTRKSRNFENGNGICEWEWCPISKMVGFGARETLDSPIRDGGKTAGVTNREGSPKGGKQKSEIVFPTDDTKFGCRIQIVFIEHWIRDLTLLYHDISDLTKKMNKN